MPIPDFQNLMLPMLQFAADGTEHRLSDTIDALAQQLKLSEAERAELLPSGIQARFDNKVGWARTHLGKAKLVESLRRGWFRITERGRSVLTHAPDRITVAYLMQYPEYVAFRTKSQPADGGAAAPVGEEEGASPAESLEASYQSIRATLAEDLLDQVKQVSPRFFERLVVDLLVAMGYGGSRRDAGKAIGRSNDGGIDGIINEDRLGLDVVYIQAKRWGSTVSRPEVQAFAGSLEGFRARKGVMITTSTFSQQAREYVGRIEKKIVLIDGEQLGQYLIDYDIGVTEVSRYVVKKIDLDYFEEE
ncbi:restriction endonuclease [Oscillochloris sp. ZM17-4]|uniref:restriction endonuclease n=1 Tax=Oscillochloris sp. ZM17-4 TaxID=2866714 RepID=UPI001C731CCD|nr:restriction endonuclease [Oscillochloris sp. ZM17-4]MBX0329919.1 restriction endonuclease [Oscillochloris sp. ZM17-4]